MGKIQRYSSVSRLKPDKAAYYQELHSAPWPQINAMIKKCNIQNYSIYIHDNMLFSYYEYIGDDYAADMAKMADDLETQRWWGECVPCMDSFTTEGPWLDIKEIYHLE